MNQFFLSTRRGLAVLAALVFIPFFAATAQQQVLELYHGDGCPHCTRELEFLPVVEIMYPNLEIQELEVWKNADNSEIFYDRMQELTGEDPTGVPTNIIEGEIVQGFNKLKLLSVLADKYGEPVVSERQAQQLWDEQKTADAITTEPGETVDPETIVIGDDAEGPSTGQILILALGGLLALGVIVSVVRTSE